MARGSRQARGYDSDWRRLRDRWLAEHPLCAWCEREGRVELGRVVDHVVSIKRAPHLRLDEGNLQTMCVECHGVKTRAEDGGGWPHG